MTQILTSSSPCSCLCSYCCCCCRCCYYCCCCYCCCCWLQIWRWRWCWGGPWQRTGKLTGSWRHVSAGRGRRPLALCIAHLTWKWLQLRRTSCHTAAKNVTRKEAISRRISPKIIRKEKISPNGKESRSKEQWLPHLSEVSLKASSIKTFHQNVECPLDYTYQ